MGRDRTIWPTQDPAGKTRCRRDRRESQSVCSRVSSPSRSKSASSNPFLGTCMAIYPGPPRGGKRRRPSRVPPCTSRCALTKTQSSSIHSSPATTKPADPELVAKLPAQKDVGSPNPEVQRLEDHKVFHREMRVEIERQSVELAALTAQVRRGLYNQPSHAHAVVAMDFLTNHDHTAVATDPLLSKVHVAVAMDPPPRHSHVVVAIDSLQAHAAVATDPLPSQAHVAVETDPPPHLCPRHGFDRRAADRFSRHGIHRLLSRRWWQQIHFYFEQSLFFN
ncbi:uncharacterized protein LOC133491007 [Syngnathoides biaculeatus]|uniref:uncharacterized protein LOC133491007 n=1 Tax=Syngnathoides biaculeatus TaxID=300417 RepID=UPI002ADD49AE|nr:uncharacterized protein LOC133491007 [Syngnathoides biaculeatus]